MQKANNLRWEGHSRPAEMGGGALQACWGLHVTAEKLDQKLSTSEGWEFQRPLCQGLVLSMGKPGYG